MAGRILIVYYSKTGNTRKIAQLIHGKVGGTVHEIQPQVPYPDSYNATVNQAKEQIRAGYMPPLRSSIDNVESYDTIIVGSPNWWSTIAPPVAAFLSTCDLSGKTVAPFCTHGGGGLGKISADIARLCPHSTIVESLGIYGSSTANSASEVTGWLRRIGIS